MANFILGKNRNTITDEEKNEFIENYSRTLIRNYIPVLDVYKNGDYKILSMESSKENNFNVSTIINYNNNEVKNNAHTTNTYDAFPFFRPCAVWI